MIRTDNKELKKADAIFTGDWHIREDVPVCRTDDFWKAQWNKMQFISALQRKHDCPILLSGDLFHHWKPSPYLLTTCQESLPNHILTVLGNHDLPQHNLDLINKSGTYNLDRSGKIRILKGIHFGKTPNPSDGLLHWNLGHNRKILVWHTMTYQAKEPYPGCTAPKAAKLLRQYPQYDVILTGDNHQPFIEEHEGRLLVNPGCITRQTAAFIDFKPRVYLYYAKTNTIQAVFLPIEEDVISREHLESVEMRDDRINAFVSRLTDEWEVGISFDENLERFAKVNNIREAVMKIVREAVS